MQFIASALLIAIQYSFLFTLHAVEIVAHRGASHEAPENTVIATKLAFEQGADGVECDIYGTADGRIAVIHDDNTKRTTGVSAKVKNMTLAELQKLDAGSWKNIKYKGEKIPSLEDLLQIIPEGRRLVVELKGGQEMIPGIQAALQAVPQPESAVEFISFSYESIAATKKTFPKHRALWLLSYKTDKKTGQSAVSIESIIEKCKEAKFDGLSLSNKWPIDAAFIDKLQAAGLDIYVWTVNDNNEAKRLAAAGMPVICTDKPAEFKELLK